MKSSAQETQIEKFVEFNEKLQSSWYQEASNYNNVVILAGYTGFFALWDRVKDFMPRELQIWAAFLMLISVFVFVIFEIVKMIVNAWVKLDYSKFLGEATRNVADIQKASESLRTKTNRIQRAFIPFWIIVLFITVPTAVIATGMMAFFFIQELFLK